MSVIFLLLVCCVVSIFGDGTEGPYDFPTYENHPCIRECKVGAPPMTCVYNFTVEYYYVLTKACYDCPYNYSDCSRPHCVAADGVSRAIITVNRMLPGPPIQVCKNDMVVVNVHNRLEGSDAITLHWHGVFVKGFQYQDGASMITQCPITPQSRYQYRFKADTRGTHYWHAHTGFHRVDGVFGTFIVREAQSLDRWYGLYDFDLPEHTMHVQDWFHEMTISKFISFVHAGFSGASPSMLINGRGAFKEFTKPGSNETFRTPYSVFKVTQNKRYRFRVISNAIQKCPIQISVDNHELVMIASDGVPFEPVVVSSFNIFNGERFDFILEADKDIGNYWIRVRGFIDCAPLAASQVAILRYENATESEPTEPTNYASGDRPGKQLNPVNTKGTTNLTPVSWLNSTDIPELKQVPDKQFYFAMDFYPLDGYRYQHKLFYPVDAVSKKMYPPQMNRINTLQPPSPLLSQYHDVPKDLFCDPSKHNISYCSKEWCECIHIIKVDLDDTVEIVLIDEGAGYRSHPMHIHGHNFRVVAMDRVNETLTIDEVKRLDAAGLIYRNLETPIAKDTVSVPDGGYTIIRFKADNPGFWLFHCHVAFHNIVGMGVVIQVGEVDAMPRPPKHFPRCGVWSYVGEEEESGGTTRRPCTSGSTASLQTITVFVNFVISVFSVFVIRR